MDLLALDSTYGLLLLLLQLNIMLIYVFFVPASHPVGHIRYLLLLEATTYGVEPRLCHDQPDTNEDVIISLIEIYVK